VTQCPNVGIGSVFENKQLKSIKMTDKKEEVGTEETQESKQEEQNTDKETSVENETSDSCQDKLEDLNRKYVLLYSDFDNFRKRSIKEKADIITTASRDVLKDLLETLDDFDRAIANNETVEDPENLKEAFKLIRHKLFNTLKTKGLEAMDAQGEKFDPEIHEAITQIPAKSKKEKGKVVDVIERGYNLKGHVLRYAKVVVGQ
jgi:molecular chaperone GrpE